MSEGFPLLTTKKIYWKGIVTELLWFLQGRTDLRFLLESDVHIWTGDAYKVYDKDFDREHPAFSAPYPKRLTVEEFEKKIIEDDEFNKWYGDLGPIYGKQWRNWCGFEKVPSGWEHGAVTHFKDVATCDQIESSIDLLKTDPDSRRNRVSAWNVSELSHMTLPPCHTDFQFYTRELSREERKEILYCRFRKGPSIINGESYVECAPTDINFEFFNTPTRAISLMWNQRSVDTFLGLPFNIASYGLLLEVIAKAVNMVPDELIGNLGDTHLYLNHIEQVNEQLGRELTIEERIDLASKKYKNFDIMDFGIPFTCTHEDIDEYYPVERRTREPYQLPRLKHMKSDDFYKSLSEDLSLITHLDASDFVLENYKSHPTIKAPLSN
jgi:thymidylate synthase